MLAGMRGAMQLYRRITLVTKKQDELMELIDVEEALGGVFTEIRKEGKKEILEFLLEDCTVDELCEVTGKKQSEILDMLNYK